MGKWLVFLMFLLLSGCGISATNRDKSRNVDESVPFFVEAFFPESGTVTALPATVTIAFNVVPYRPSLGALTHYNLNCGDYTQAARSVDSASGFSSVEVTLPDMGTLAAGTVCTLAVTPDIRDPSGNRLGGIRTVSYTISP